MIKYLTILMMGLVVSFQTLAKTEFGMLYFLWHCPATKNIHDISLFLEEKKPLGDFGAFHYWERPAEGYYCLSEREDILEKHARQLRDAGVDFLVVDSTNHAFQNQSAISAREMIQEPFLKLLEVFSRIEGAPKLVPWVPIFERADMVDFLTTELKRYPELEFTYQGKPLLLAVAHNSTESKINEYKPDYTVRKMWGHNPVQVQHGEWSFLQVCRPGFRESQGHQECQQKFTLNGSRKEQISITMAYQETLMTMPTAVGKNQGRTFLRQFETLEKNRDIDIAIITGWNEWIAQRFCPDGTLGTCAEDEYGFVDAFDADRNRDIEPSESEGDRYYQLVKSKILEYKSFKGPDTPPRANLDRITDNGITSGWAFDVDDLFGETEIHFYSGGPAGTGKFAGAIKTSFLRPDVNQVFSIQGNHGFQAKLDEQFAGSMIHAYAINRGGNSTNPELANSPMEYKAKVIPSPPPSLPGVKPMGYFDVLFDTGLAVGWAFDRDVLGEATRIEFYAGGPKGSGEFAGETLTSHLRQDVNDALHVPGRVGFRFQLEQKFQGKEIYAYALNQGGGNGDTLLNGSPKLLVFKKPPQPTPKPPELKPLFRHYHQGFHTITIRENLPGKEAVLGKIDQAPSSGLKPLYECLAGNINSFISHDSRCEGQKPLGKLGYLSSDKTGTHPVPLYRCRVGGNHFASLDPRCEGQIFEALMGHIRP